MQQNQNYNQCFQLQNQPCATNPTSYNGWPIKCKNMQIYTPGRGENAVLYTGREKIEAQDLTSEARNCAVLDSGFHWL